MIAPSMFGVRGGQFFDVVGACDAARRDDGYGQRICKRRRRIHIDPGEGAVT